MSFPFGEGQIGESRQIGSRTARWGTARRGDGPEVKRTANGGISDGGLSA